MTSAPHDAQDVDDRLAHDLPLDSHVHTELSHDSDVPLHLYAAAARARNISEIAVTDHLDFDRRDPNFKLHEYERRRRLVREAAERWEGRPHLRFGAEITFERRLEPEIRDYLATHPYDYVIGSVHISERTPLKDAHEAARWCAGKTPAEAAGWYFDEVLGAIRSGLFDTIGHLDFVKRWLVPFVSVGYATSRSCTNRCSARSSSPARHSRSTAPACDSPRTSCIRHPGRSSASASSGAGT
jgi:HisJ family histidinol phosphate phosphatase